MVLSWIFLYYVAVENMWENIAYFFLIFHYMSYIISMNINIVSDASVLPI
jgi:hypothetical protein